MAIAKFHSFRGENSALCMVKANQFVFASTAVYIPKDAVPATAQQGDEFQIPDGYKVVPFVDFATGEVRTTKEGAQLHTLEY